MYAIVENYLSINGWVSNLIGYTEAENEFYEFLEQCKFYISGGTKKKFPKEVIDFSEIYKHQIKNGEIRTIEVPRIGFKKD